LTLLYDQMAVYLLPLSKVEFPCIGSLLPSGNNDLGSSCSVKGHPITTNINYLIDLANIPPAILPPKGTTYATSDEWYLALA
jgi:hypothetical protein